MSDYKIILGYIAVFISLGSYIPYFRDIFIGHTKPHAFSWLVWGLLTGIAFAVQISEGGGAGTWVTGVTALTCFTVFVLAFVKGQRKFILFDWISLFGALTSLLLWKLAHDATLAVILLTLTDILGFLPTFRKGYYKPHEETIITFICAALKFVIAIIALESLTLVTWFYPAATILINGSYVAMILIRRKTLKDQKLPLHQNHE